MSQTRNTFVVLLKFSINYSFTEVKVDIVIEPKSTEQKTFTK